MSEREIIRDAEYARALANGCGCDYLNNPDTPCVLCREERGIITTSLVAAIERATAAETECARLRRMLDTSPPWRVSDPPTDEEMHALRLRWATGPERYQADADALIAAVMHGRSERAKITARAEAAEQERDAALAAVDAMRADYAPRREPPTADEVRAVSRLWGRDHAVRCVAWQSDEHGRWSESWNTGGFAAEVKALPNTAYMLFGPDGPVAWSELAALVRGGDRG